VSEGTERVKMMCKCGRQLEDGEWGSETGMRLVDWGRDSGEDRVTIETSVGHLLPHERNAVLAALLAFAREFTKDSGKKKWGACK
jgi:hypothetical protein